MRLKLGIVFLATMLTIAAFCLLFIYADAIWDQPTFWTYMPARLYLYLALGFLIGGLALNVIIGNLLVGHAERLIHYIGITSLLGGGLLINLVLIIIALTRQRAPSVSSQINEKSVRSGLFTNALAAAVLMALGTLLLGIHVGLLTQGVADWNPVLKKWSNEIASNARLAMAISGGMLIMIGFIYSFVMGIIALVKNKQSQNDLGLVIGVAALCGGGLLINVVLPIMALRANRQSQKNSNKSIPSKPVMQSMA